MLLPSMMCVVAISHSRRGWSLRRSQRTAAISAKLRTHVGARAQRRWVGGASHGASWWSGRNTASGQVIRSDAIVRAAHVAARVARGAWRAARGAWRTARGAWRVACGARRVARGAWGMARGARRTCSRQQRKPSSPAATRRRRAAPSAPPPPTARLARRARREAT
eukprot:7381419-Prymnesium_polylepis.2